MLRRVTQAPVFSSALLRSTASSVSTMQLARRWATYEIVVKDLGGESVLEGKIASVSVKVGDEIPEDTILYTIESDKSSIEVRNDKSGVVKSLAFNEGDIIKKGSSVAVIDEKEVAKKKKKASAESPVAAAAAEEKTPKAAADQSAAAPKESSSAPSAAAVPPPAPKPAGGARTTYEKKIPTIRAKIAERLKSSQNENALLTTFNEIDVTDLVNTRSKYKDAFEKKHGVKFGLMSPFLKAAAHALMEVPVINASWKGDVIEYRDFVDISVAVSAPKGLFVPVLRNVEQMTYADIEKQLEFFAQKAKDNKITPDDMAGGTFTVSNGGTFGSWMGTPIVNPPQSAILGMHAIKKKPWVNEKDEIVVRQIMAVALTYDHRLIDGRDAVTFLVKIKNAIEDPVRMLLDLV